MIKWLSMTETAKELGFKDPRTFRDNYISDYPPDRTNKQLKWWKQTTVDYIKETEFPDRIKKS